MIPFLGMLLIILFAWALIALVVILLFQGQTISWSMERKIREKENELTNQK